MNQFMQKLSSPALKPLRFGWVLTSGGRLFHKFIAAGRRLPLYTLVPCNFWKSIMLPFG